MLHVHDFRIFESTISSISRPSPAPINPRIEDKDARSAEKCVKERGGSDPRFYFSVPIAPPSSNKEGGCFRVSCGVTTREHISMRSKGYLWSMQRTPYPASIDAHQRLTLVHQYLTESAMSSLQEEGPGRARKSLGFPQRASR